MNQFVLEPGHGQNAATSWLYQNSEEGGGSIFRFVKIARGSNSKLKSQNFLPKSGARNSRGPVGHPLRVRLILPTIVIYHPYKLPTDTLQLSHLMVFYYVLRNSAYGKTFTKILEKQFFFGENMHLLFNNRK